MTIKSDFRPIKSWFKEGSKISNGSIYHFKFDLPADLILFQVKMEGWYEEDEEAIREQKDYNNKRRPKRRRQTLQNSSSSSTESVKELFFQKVKHVKVIHLIYVLCFYVLV